MELLRDILLGLHLLGLAALLVGLLIQATRPGKAVNGLVRDGSGTAFVTGLLLVGVLESGDDPVDHAKVAVKGIVGLVILVLAMANLRQERISTGLWALLLALTIANVCVAVLWSSASA